MFPFMRCSFWHIHTIHTCKLRTICVVCRLLVIGCSRCPLCLAMFRVDVIVVIMHQAWTSITDVCKWKQKKYHKQVIGISFCTWLPKQEKKQKKKKSWNDATVYCRTPVHSSSVLPLATWHRQSGWISSSADRSDLRLVISPPTCGTHESLWWRLIPDLSQEGSELLLNRKWMRSNAPIRLWCGETKHHHPTGRK